MFPFDDVIMYKGIYVVITSVIYDNQGVTCRHSAPQCQTKILCCWYYFRIQQNIFDLNRTKLAVKTHHLVFTGVSLVSGSMSWHHNVNISYSLTQESSVWFNASETTHSICEECVTLEISRWLEEVLPGFGETEEEEEEEEEEEDASHVGPSGENHSEETIGRCKESKESKCKTISGFVKINCWSRLSLIVII